MKKEILVLSFLFVLIFSSCSDDSINLAGTTWTSVKDWYGKIRLSFEEGTPHLKSFFVISSDLRSFITYNIVDDNEDLEYGWKGTVSGKYSINDNIMNLVVGGGNLAIPYEIEKDIIYYSNTRMKPYKQ